MLLIGAFRPRDVGPTHPLRRFEVELGRARTTASRIDCSPRLVKRPCRSCYATRSTPSRPAWLRWRNSSPRRPPATPSSCESSSLLCTGAASYRSTRPSAGGTGAWPRSSASGSRRTWSTSCSRGSGGSPSRPVSCSRSLPASGGSRGSGSWRRWRARRRRRRGRPCSPRPGRACSWPMRRRANTTSSTTECRARRTRSCPSRPARSFTSVSGASSRPAARHVSKIRPSRPPTT